MFFSLSLTIKLIPGHLGYQGGAFFRMEVRAEASSQETGARQAGAGLVVDDSALRAGDAQRQSDVLVLQDLADPGRHVASALSGGRGRRTEGSSLGAADQPYWRPPEIEALIPHLRKERQYGGVRLSYFLKRYHQVFVPAPTILRVFKENQVPRVSLKRCRPSPGSAATLS